ncbi:hypothetical protein [Streptomyces sp. NPDC050738]|uniref:hypothetical protein n=1 Tax=Streptomyces sp. NPDC050738 TaxID=3154744 RepID=UPI003418DB9F
MSGSWRLMQGDIHLGDLHQYEIDQPTFLCHFTPGPGWETVRDLFEAWAAVQGADPDGSRHTEAVRPLVALDLTLAPMDGSTPMRCFKDCIVRIYGDVARLRY